MSAVDYFNLIANLEIEADVNSDRLSPRQVLIVDRQDLPRFAIAPEELRENIALRLNKEIISIFNIFVLTIKQ